MLAGYLMVAGIPICYFWFLNYGIFHFGLIHIPCSAILGYNGESFLISEDLINNEFLRPF